MKLKSELELLKYISYVSKENDIKITPTEKAFFISFLKHVLKEGEYDEESEMFFIQRSSRELSEILGFTYHVTCNAMKVLDDCSLIQRVEVEKDFKHLSGGEYQINQPNFTYVDMDLFTVKGE